MAQHPDEFGFRTFVLNFQATHLPSMDLLSPSDGYLVLYERDTTNVDLSSSPSLGLKPEWIRIGHTEIIMDIASPIWQKNLTVELNQIGIQSGHFKIEIWDADEHDVMVLEDQDMIGEALFDWSIFPENGTGKAVLGLTDKNGKVVVSKNNPSASVIITCTEYPQHPRKACVTIDSTYPKDNNADTVVQFVQIVPLKPSDSTTAAGGSKNSTLPQPTQRETIVYQTPISTGTYPPFIIDEDQLYNTKAHIGTENNGSPTVVEENIGFRIISEEIDSKIKITDSILGPGEFEVRLVKWKNSMNTTVLGNTTLPATHESLGTMNNNTHSQHVLKMMNINPKKRSDVIGNVRITNWRSHINSPSFNDFQNSNLNFKLNFAIDCSGTHGEKRSLQNSLHDLNSSNQNLFTRSINDIGNILINSLGQNNVSSIKSFGFGGPAQDPYAINPEEAYSLSLKTSPLPVSNINDIIGQYMTFTKIPFSKSSPTSTNFAPFLRHFNDKILQVKENIIEVSAKDGILMNNPIYNVLVIFTDGEICDKKETMEVLFDLSNKPVSVIFIGIGQDNSIKYPDLLKFNTELNGDGVLRFEKNLHLMRHFTTFYPYLPFSRCIEYFRIRLFRTLQKQVITQFFLANKFPVPVPGAAAKNWTDHL